MSKPQPKYAIGQTVFRVVEWQENMRAHTEIKPEKITGIIYKPRVWDGKPQGFYYRITRQFRGETLHEDDVQTNAQTLRDLQVQKHERMVAAWKETPAPDAKPNTTEQPVALPGQKIWFFDSALRIHSAVLESVQEQGDIYGYNLKGGRTVYIHVFASEKAAKNGMKAFVENLLGTRNHE